MAPNKVVLIACGSFNPPTHMHLRLFEIARDYLQKMGICEVLFGIISPVHDAYGKKDLAQASHRLAMAKLASESSDWIRVSDWECKQMGHSRTYLVLKHHQDLINNMINNKLNDNVNEEEVGFIPNFVLNNLHGNIQVKLICGGDLLESFGIPGLWSDADIEDIVKTHGLVVISRENSNPHKFIYNSDILTRYMRNIHIVTEWITNDISSTKIRRALGRNDSVKYLVPDKVIEYITKNELYNSEKRPKKHKLITREEFRKCILCVEKKSIQKIKKKKKFKIMQTKRYCIACPNKPHFCKKCFNEKHKNKQ
nr:nicotinamide/nicotinic acid mononucleotide adenylyltransferase 3 isoform X3 [Onthophagus taurus]